MAGRPTELNDELMLKIRALVLDGLELPQIAEALDIPYETMRSWQARNYHQFAERYRNLKRERMLLKAEVNLEATLASEDERLRHDASKFVTETLGKKAYSKQINQDHTTGGEKITFSIAKEIAEKNAITPETEGDSQ